MNPNLPPEIFTILANDEEEIVRQYLAMNPNLPPEIFSILANDEDIGYYLAKNPNVTPEILGILAKHKSLRGYLARHSNLPPEVFAIFAKSKDSNIRQYLAMNPNLPPEIFSILANDEEESVRKALAKNPNNPVNKTASFANIFYKCAQVGSPNVKIQPGRPETNCAVDILKLYKPDYFMQVEEIILGASSDYGHVESGPGKNPAVIHVNIDRVVQEAGGQQSGKAAALACAKVIAHEKGHVSSFNKEQGFVGGEAPAEQEERNFENWLESGGMQQVENLPSYKALH
jgi:hypothetical protein